MHALVHLGKFHQILGWHWKWYWLPYHYWLWGVYRPQWGIFLWIHLGNRRDAVTGIASQYWGYKSSIPSMLLAGSLFASIHALTSARNLSPFPLIDRMLARIMIGSRTFVFLPLSFCRIPPSFPFCSFMKKCHRNSLGILAKFSSRSLPWKCDIAGGCLCCMHKSRFQAGLLSTLTANKPPRSNKTNNHELIMLPCAWTSMSQWTCKDGDP